MKITLLLIALVGAASAVPSRQQRIVGGEPTNIERYRYFTAMEYSWWGISWSQSCGGAFVTSITVVSAAHCYEGDSTGDWRARAGTSFRHSGGSIHNFAQMILHPAYSSATLDYDFAIIRLATPAIMGPQIATVAIAGTNYHLQDNTPVTTIGLGTLSSGGPSPSQLQHVHINTINQQICAQRYAHLKTLPGFQNWPDVTDRMLCAGILDVGGKDACQGDSGGPLVHNNNGNYVLVGATSWGYSCAHPQYPGISARISSVSDWIVANGST